MISVRMATVLVLLGASGAVAQPVRPGRTAAAPAATAAAPAPGVPAGPQQTTATFGDWTLRCVRPAGTGKLCEVAQIVQQDGKPVAQLAVGSASKAQKLQFTVLVAPNVSFAATPALVPPGEDGAGQALNWRRCLPGGCIADAEIGDDLLAKMRGWTQPARVTFVDAGGRGVALPVSPTGLGPALDALAKEDPG